MSDIDINSEISCKTWLMSWTWYSLAVYAWKTVDYCDAKMWDGKGPVAFTVQVGNKFIFIISCISKLVNFKPFSMQLSVKQLQIKDWCLVIKLYIGMPKQTRAFCLQEHALALPWLTPAFHTCPCGVTWPLWL